MYALAPTAALIANAEVYLVKSVVADKNILDPFLQNEAVTIL